MNPYVLSLLNPGCKWGRKHGNENWKEKRFLGLACWWNFWDSCWKRCFTGASLTWEAQSTPSWTYQEGKLWFQLSPNLCFVYHQPWTIGEMGKRTDDWFESRQWKNKFCMYPPFPKPPFCAPVWWLMDQHFPSKRERHPSQLPWQRNRSPVN